MNRKHILYIAVILVTLCGCGKDQAAREREKWRISLEPDDKRPYGTWLFANSMKYFFPAAAMERLSPGFRYDNMDNKMKGYNNGCSLIILSGLDFRVSDEEWYNLKQFVSNGNELVIFCSILDEKIEKDLSCNKDPGEEEQSMTFNQQLDLHNLNVLSLGGISGKRYGYEGRSIKGHFSVEIDTVNTISKNDTSDDDSYDETNIYAPDTLGYANERPDILRYRVGDGHITLHAAPLVTSNYFLLQSGNIDYLTGVLRTLPENINKVYTHSYYKRSGSGSGLSVLWKYPATKWALLLGLFILLVYVFFEGKRKQRIIPIVAPLKNDSVSFVETVGRLYYNKGNHTNLADKMLQQFLEWVRMNYYLNTNLLNEHFTQQLTIKSGQSENTVRELMDMIHEIRLRSVKIDDPYLYKLYNTIHQFYKNDRI